ncbi:MAG: hypothetical protein JSS93_10150, partial [Bacteroidetes bacterium]|nr:hypothetical protein [Bacteroidota bacterium]
LTQNSWTRDNTRNNFLYNEGSELNTTTGLYDLPFRNYDAALKYWKGKIVGEEHQQWQIERS